MAPGAGLSLAAALDFGTLPSQVVNGVLNGAIYALIALGYTMVYGVLRLINFAHGEVYMLGAYTALFVSWAYGFRPDVPPDQLPESSLATLLVMMLASMAVCATVGVLIERFAYRPMRNQARISSLITAIGVSLLLQYGGGLFLPQNPPPTMNERVNPYRQTLELTLVGAPRELSQAVEAAREEFQKAERAFEERLQAEKDRFNLSPEGERLRDAKFEAERRLRDAESRLNSAQVTVRVSAGRLAILLASLALMFLLRQLVLFTPTGRAMRAVSQDFDSAALMGVNVDRIVTITFVIGSALAGAGAMMTATFLGTSITPYYGVLPGVKAFVAAVLGGIGNIPGAVLGGLLMGLAETLVIWAGYSQFADAVAFVVLIVVLLFRPGGLLGSSAVEKV